MCPYVLVALGWRRSSSANNTGTDRLSYLAARPFPIRFAQGFGALRPTAPQVAAHAGPG